MGVVDVCRAIGHALAPKHHVVGALALLVFLLSAAQLIFIKRPSVVMSFDEGYTTPDAPSLQEMDAQIQFFSGTGSPWYMALFGEPKHEDGNMLNNKEFSEMKHFYRMVKQNLTINYKSNNYTYYDYCGNSCDFNDAIFMTQSMVSNFGFLGLAEWGWPVTYVAGYKSNIGKFFYTNKVSETGELQNSQLFFLAFMVFVNGTDTLEGLEQFEQLVAREARLHNEDEKNIVHLTVHGAGPMQEEIKRGFFSLTPFLVTGFAIMATLLICSFIIINRTHRTCGPRVILLWFCALLVPSMALITTLSIFAITGKHLNSLTFLSPALIFPMGIDGILMMYHCFLLDTQIKRLSYQDRLTEVFGECLPSLGLSLVSAFSLFVAALLPIPEFSSFCLFLGIGLAATFFYQTFFFPWAMMKFSPPVVLHTMLADSETKSLAMETGPNPSQLLDDIIEAMTRKYCQDQWIKYFALIVLIVSLILPLGVGVHQARGNLDYRDLLSKDSPARQGVHFMSDVVWPEFLHVLFFINHPPNFADPESYARYKAFVEEVRSMDSAIGRESNMVWLSDFISHTQQENQDRLNMTLFKGFITHNIYKAWNSGVRYTEDENGTVTITKMILMVGMEGTTSMADKATLIHNCREVAARYPEFDIRPFDTEVGMVDVITQTPKLIPITYCILVLFAVALGIIFIWNVTVTFAWVFISFVLNLGTIGVWTLLGNELNPFSVAFLILSPVLALKVHVHFAFFYQQSLWNIGKGDAMDRMQRTLRHTLLPTVLSTITGSALFLPLLFVSVALMQSVGTFNIIFFFYSLLSQIFIFPVLLAWLPNFFTGTGCITTNNK